MGMNVPNQLVEVISDTTELRIYETGEMVVRSRFIDVLFPLVEDQRAAKMHRPHPGSVGARSQPFILGCRQAQVELLLPRFCFR